MHAYRVRTYAQYTTRRWSVSWKTTKQCTGSMRKRSTQVVWRRTRKGPFYANAKRALLLIKNGQLYHQQFNRGKSSEQAEDHRKLCIKSRDKKDGVLKSCHSAATGRFLYTLGCVVDSTGGKEWAQRTSSMWPLAMHARGSMTDWRSPPWSYILFLWHQKCGNRYFCGSVMFVNYYVC